MDLILLLLKVLLVLFLVLLNGLFVAAEFSLVKLRTTQLNGLIAGGSRRAKLALNLIQNLDASLSACQLGITLASLGLGWVGEPVFASMLEPVMEWLQVNSPQARHTIAFITGFSVITFLHIVVGELAPKSIAIQKALATSLWVAHPLHWFHKMSYPFIWALNGASLQILRWLGVEPASESELVHSEEELRLLITASQKHTRTTALGREVVLSALDLGLRVARDVMRPRQEIDFFDTRSSLAECLELAEKTRFSRFPICEDGDLDKTLGVIHFKDLFTRCARFTRAAEFVHLARKIVYVPETARLEKLLQLFLDRKLHFAIVVDEFGGTVGMVTLENILEELVGQIQDEFDHEQPQSMQISADRWNLSGTLPLHDLEDLVLVPLEEEGITTTSGWVTHRMGGFPKVGDKVDVGQFTLEVETMDGLRVASLRLYRKTDLDGPIAE